MTAARFLIVVAAVSGAFAPSCLVSERPVATVAPEPVATVGAVYAIPPDAPRGELKAISYGVVEVSAQDGTGDVLRAIHLRAVVTNGSDKAWTFDAREQRLEVDAHGPSAPAFVSADAGDAPPIVTIAPGKLRVVDLFFVLPTDLQAAAELPGFDADWSVNTGGGVVAERTPFERLSLEPLREYAVYDYGPAYFWGPPYWYNPLWVGFRVGGAVPLGPRFIERPVRIHRPAPHVRMGGGRHR